MQQTGYIIFNQKNNKKINNGTKVNKKKYPTNYWDNNIQPSQLVKQDEETSEERLQTLTKSTDEFEYRIKAFWIFELFPNEVVIDIHKVSFIDKTLMFKNVTSIFIKDIAKVEVTNDIFFATLEIINVTQTISLQIKHLKKDDARNALAIIQGLMVGYKNDIDLAELDPEKTLDELMKLGSPVT